MIFIRPVLIFALFLFWSFPAVEAAEETLEGFLDRAVESSEELKAIDLDIESLRLEIASRDLELSPTLAVEFDRFWDNRPSSSSSRQTSGQSTLATVRQPLATGTSLSLSSYLESADYLNNSDEQNLLNWQLGVSQSLWQNRFGRQTALRRQRDREELQSRLLTLMLNRQSIVIEFERLYWTLAYAQQEFLIRQENLERSRRILAWIEDRVDRAAAEHVDLLQGQTLVSSRELQLQLAADNLRTLQARLKERLPRDSETIPVIDELNKTRDLSTLPARAVFAPQAPVLIETLQSQSQTGFLEAKAKLDADRLKPVLDVGYSYGQQGFSPSFAAAREQASSRRNDYHQIGVVFSMPFDFPLIRKSRMAGEKAAQAQALRTTQSRRQSGIQWDDLVRTIGDQRQRVETARRLADLQTQKSQEERLRYEKGRTTAFQAITFEQDAAESRLLVVQLLNQLRQTEAQARLYIQKGRQTP